MGFCKGELGSFRSEIKGIGNLESKPATVKQRNQINEIMEHLWKCRYNRMRGRVIEYSGLVRMATNWGKKILGLIILRGPF
jgi:hypothetical protein